MQFAIRRLFFDIVPKAISISRAVPMESVNVLIHVIYEGFVTRSTQIKFHLGSSNALQYLSKKACVWFGKYVHSFETRKRFPSLGPLRPIASLLEQSVAGIPTPPVALDCALYAGTLDQCWRLITFPDAIFSALNWPRSWYGRGAHC